MLEETDVIEFNYELPRFTRLISSYLADFFIFLFLSILLIVPGVFILEAIPNFQNVLNTRNQILVDSKLYIKKDKLIRLDTFYKEDTNLTYNEKSEELNLRLTYFFTTFINNDLENKGLETYNNIKSKGNFEGDKLFDENFNRVLINSDYDETYFNFYLDAYNTALGYLQVNKSYVENRNNVIFGYVLTIILASSVSFITLFLIIPLIFNRGKKTLGMLFTHLSLINIRAFSVSNKCFCFRFLFQFFVMFLASLFSFLIPILISFGFLIFSKRRQTLTNYIFNTYIVYNENQIVYLNLKEYQIKNKKLKENFIDNKLDLNL